MLDCPRFRSGILATCYYFCTPSAFEDRNFLGRFASWNFRRNVGYTGYALNDIC
jgi:hypothetical protein